MPRSPKAGAGGLQLVGVDGHDRYAGIQDSLHEDPLGALYGHPPYPQLDQSATKPFYASLVVGEATLEDLVPSAIDDAEGVLVLGPVYPCCWSSDGGGGGVTFVLIHVSH